MSNFRLRGYTRRIMAYLVDVIGPRWTEADFDTRTMF